MCVRSCPQVDGGAALIFAPRHHRDRRLAKLALRAFGGAHGPFCAALPPRADPRHYRGSLTNYAHQAR
jgi:hypothetical protein